MHKRSLVPNERSDADTTKLQVKLPDGFIQASFQPVAGWTVKVTTSKLSTPVKTDDGTFSEQVSEITWTGHGKDGRIPPGGFQDFPLSVLVPDKAGSRLTFKAVQTYSNGSVVRWIGPESSENPGPTLELTAARAAGDPAPAPATASSGGDTLAIIALVVGALALIGAGVALAATRRERARVA